MKFFLLIFSLQIHVAFCQNSYTKYFSYVNKAELALCDSNWSVSLYNYKKAFDQKKMESYSFDIHNAIVCSILLNKMKDANKFAKILILKGCDTVYFNKNCFAKLRESKGWIKFIGNYSKQNYRHQKNNIHLAAIVDSLYVIDQEKKESRKSFFVSNAKLLKKEIELSHYPSESVIGIRSENNRFIDKAAFILFHYKSYYRNEIDIDSLLFSRVKKGEMHPSYFAWLPFKKANYYYSINENNALLIIGNELYEVNPNYKQLLEINKKRNDINLPDLDSFKKITKFYLKDRRFVYPVDGRIMIIESFTDENSKKSLLKEYKEIGKYQSL